MKPGRRSAGRKGEPSRGGGPAENGGATDAIDRLEYMSDLILELKHMAERSGLDALAGALGAAHRVARNELKGREGS